MFGALDEASSINYIEPLLFHFLQHFANLLGAQPTELIKKGISERELRKRKS